jgi:folate-binding protein YgfZ
VPWRRAARGLLQGYNFIVLSAMQPPNQMPAASAPQQVAPTPLCAALAQTGTFYCGALTPQRYHGFPEELDSLLHSAGVSDLGWRARILVTGSDRLRWLNGMVSNTVQALPEGQGNYSFLLSVQGRIQGDCYVYRRADDLLLDTSLDQLPVLKRHLDHFIVMDDVELADVSGQWTALALTGPAAPRILETLGVTLSTSNAPNTTITSGRIGEVPCALIEGFRVTVPRFELWFAPEHALAVWETLQAAGANPCGLEALEALRVLEATPLFGVDLNDRDLPQETAQTRALNFNKGCYLGQEIVERIRSRGKVNRQFRQFTLQSAAPALPFDLRSGDQTVGRITSTASLASAGIPETIALGFIRLEVSERNAEITYEGGAATTLTAPPSLTRPLSSQP